ncbi:MAG: hypothetical protein MPJ50_16340 [Pirellulales bacterium]|nr:hypothetical protein [Pirellulales bacterium]
MWSDINLILVEHQEGVSVELNLCNLARTELNRNTEFSGIPVLIFDADDAANHIPINRQNWFF